MNEEPKSIWKKQVPMSKLPLVWIGLMFTTLLIILAVAMSVNAAFPVSVIFVSSVAGATVMLALWLFARWLCCWRNFMRFLFGLACFITLVALFYAEENWRGKRVWEKFKQEGEAKGIRFDFASLVPRPVPDDQNFALTPIVASSYLHILDRTGHRIQPPNMNVINQLEMELCLNSRAPTNGIGDWRKGTQGDLKAWQQYYRGLAAITNLFPVPPQPQGPGADVLLALSKYGPVIEGLREASRLPCSRFPLNYDSESPSAIMLPHLAALKKSSLVLQLRSLAELQNGQPDKALADVKLALQLTDKIRTEPLLISHLVRIAIVQIMLQPVWEGLAEHRWSEEQLAALDAELAKLDFLADYQLSMRGELGCQGGEMDRVRRHPELLRGLYGMSNGEEGAMYPPSPGRLAIRLIPAGWLYQNQLRCARMMVDYYLPLADVNQGTVSPTLARRGDAALMAEVKTATPFNVLERLMLPALGNCAKRFAFGQNAANQARVACALERYRLVHGEYPGSLDALVPRFITKLPHDVISGQSLHYRRDPPSPGSGAAGGEFVLYSVGWNETDDGGVVAFTKGGSADVNTGDWVWRYPQK